MKQFFTLLCTISITTGVIGQSIPRNANTIVVKGISFNDICSALLDSGYSIEKKDSDLQTVRTAAKQFPKYWNATYTINIRVKDSIAFVTGTLAVADGGLWKNEPIYNHVNKKGEPFKKSLFGYPFFLIDEFARSLKKEISYEKR